MKITKVVPILVLLIIGFLSSCDSEEVAVVNSTNESIELRTSQTEWNVREAVDLGSAENFVILSKSGITNVYKSNITGNVGTSPITGAALLLECDEVTGTVYTVDAAGPACRIIDPSRLTSAVSDMQTAYTDSAGRDTPDYLNLGAGSIAGDTLTRGLYRWTSALLITGDLLISGNEDDVFIFQIAGDLDMNSGVNITLAGGAQAKNIFWQTSGKVTLGTTSHFEGNILSQTAINLRTGASINGRLYAQTEVTLQMNTVTDIPAEIEI